MALDTTVWPGWGPEATVETDPITAGTDPYYKFGALTAPFKLPATTQKVLQTYQGNRDPSSTILTQSAIDPLIVCWPVNGLWFYYFLGDSATASSIHTVTGINSGTLPTITYRWETKGGTHERFKSVVGCRLETIAFLINSNPQSIPASLTLGFAGIKHQNATLNSAYSAEAGNPSRIFPSSKSDLYHIDTNTVFNWDQSGTPNDYSADLISFQYNGVNNLHKANIENQTEREYILEGTRIQTVSFEIHRGTDRAMFDDLEAGTKRDLRATFYNTSSNYLQFDFTNCFLIKDDQNAFRATATDPYTEKFFATVDSLSLKSKDGVADSFYGD